MSDPLAPPRQLVSRAQPRLGVLGAARIVPKALLVPNLLEPGKVVDVCAVAARDLGRARTFASEHGIPDAHGSYEELLARADIDAVYVALPAALHAEWTLAALAAGKHVLCEKPFGLSAQEAETAVARAAAQGLLLMEAHHWRYHPLAQAFCDALVEVGPVKEARAVFDAPIRGANIRFDPRLGAGVLLDFGCYTVQWLALATGDDAPEILAASADQGDPGVDLTFRATLRSKAGARLSLSCDMQPSATFVAFVDVVGERGRVRFENPLNGDDARLIIETSGRPTARIEASGPSTYRRQLETFAAALAQGSEPLTSGPSIIATQRMLDRLYRAAGLPGRDELGRAVSP